VEPLVLAQSDRKGHGSVAGLLQPVLQEYARALEMPILIYAPDTHVSPPRGGGGLHLHIFALPARPHRLSILPVTPSLDMPAVLPGDPHQGMAGALAPGSLFTHGRLKHDPQGRAIAGVLSDNIYLFFDLFGYPGNLMPVALRKSLDLCLSGMTEWLSLQSGRLPHQIQVALHRLSHRTTLMTLDHTECGDQGNPPDPSDGSAGAIRDQMAVVEHSLKELSRQMALQTRLLGSCRERVRTLKEAGQSENLLAREFEALLEVPEVREVEVLGDRLRIFTDTVDTIVAGKRYRLGCFRLDIRFNGEVAITNLTQPYGYYDHPHVWNAKPCLGNIRPNVSKLVGEFQWVATAELLLEYLKTVNPNGWYTPIDHWEELPA